MRDLTTVARQLRLVRNARRRFLEFWKLERELIHPLLDRMADDLVESASASSVTAATRAAADAEPRAGSD